MGEVGRGALDDPVAFPAAFTQQGGGTGTPVGDDSDVPGRVTQKAASVKPYIFHQMGTKETYNSTQSTHAAPSCG